MAAHLTPLTAIHVRQTHRMRQLTAIGFWADYEHPGWPDPREFIAPDADEDESREIASYLDRGVVVQVWRGWSRCRICGYDRNGHADLTDGTYLWPEGPGEAEARHRLCGIFLALLAAACRAGLAPGIR